MFSAIVGGVIGAVSLGMGAIQMIDSKRQEKKADREQQKQRVKNKLITSAQGKVNNVVSKLNDRVDYSDNSSQTINNNTAINTTKRAYERALNNYEKKLQ